jgi:uncharacterized OB-fold protein
MLNARGLPTSECPNCGCVYFKVVVQFDPVDYEIGLYFLDAECNDCGTLVTVPTPIDHPNLKQEGM